MAGIDINGVISVYWYSPESLYFCCLFMALLGVLAVMSAVQAIRGLA
ncbi:hypothetical protein ID854_11555 [Xenorhabdus sp. M]|uniref:Uncharacterized protein n=1 Tax=Xenorhabdus szentirmaii TaxID=290112 RepID=A0AAW3YU21_9GAMM|nr:hypothetical protein [Xenorhabdus sp. M]MBD2801071.1 hypothetical protein [Xenorhabdus sp. M]